jgi:hypothetical protein
MRRRRRRKTIFVEEEVHLLSSVKHRPTRPGE